MISRLLKHKDAVLEVLNDALKLTFTLPTETDWNRLEGLKTTLLPLETATVALGGEHYATCGILLPLFSHLLNTMKANDDDPGYISKFKSLFYADMQPRKELLLKKSYLLCGSALDPRFKSLKFLNREQRSNV